MEGSVEGDRRRRQSGRERGLVGFGFLGSVFKRSETSSINDIDSDEDVAMRKVWGCHVTSRPT